MFGGGFKASKLKAQLQASGARLTFRRTKKQNELGPKKRDIAQLLASGQEPRAKIRVEDLIREEGNIEAFEHLELYCELVVARLRMIEMQKTCPADLKEAVSSIVFAAPRAAEIPELMEVRNSFLAKFGKDFIIAAEELRPDCKVSRLIINRLSVRTPPAEEKLERLKKVAEEQKVEWDPAMYLREIREQRDAFPGTYRPSTPAKLQGPAPGQSPISPQGSPLSPPLQPQTPTPPPPPRPFQPQTPPSPGQPTEMLLPPPAQQLYYSNNRTSASTITSNNRWPGGSPGGIDVGNPLDYPAPLLLLDGKPLAKDAMDYAHPGVGGIPQAGTSGTLAGHQGAEESLFPCVPRVPPKGGSGGGSGAPGGYQVSSSPPLGPVGSLGAHQGSALGPGGEGGGVAERGPAGVPGGFTGDGRGAGGGEGGVGEGVFSHTAAFERKRQEREQRMREIVAVGDRASAAAERASAAVGLGVNSTGSIAGSSTVPNAVKYSEKDERGSSVLPGGGVGAGGKAGRGGAVGMRFEGEVQSRAGEGKEEDVLPSPPQGFAGASGLDSVLAQSRSVQGRAEGRGGGGEGRGLGEDVRGRRGGGGGMGELGGTDSDFFLPSPPRDWDAPALDSEAESVLAPGKQSPAEAGQLAQGVGANRGVSVLERQGSRLPPPPPPPPAAFEFDRFVESHPHHSDDPDPDSPLPDLADLKARFDRLIRRSKDMTQPTGY